MFDIEASVMLLPVSEAGWNVRDLVKGEGFPPIAADGKKGHQKQRGEDHGAFDCFWSRSD